MFSAQLGPKTGTHFSVCAVFHRAIYPKTGAHFSVCAVFHRAIYPKTGAHFSVCAVFQRAIYPKTGAHFSVCAVFQRAIYPKTGAHFSVCALVKQTLAKLVNHLFCLVYGGLAGLIPIADQICADKPMRAQVIPGTFFNPPCQTELTLFGNRVRNDPEAIVFYGFRLWRWLTAAEQFAEDRHY